MPRARVRPRPRPGCAVAVRPRGDLVPLGPGRGLPAVVEGEVVLPRRRRWPSAARLRSTGLWAGGSGAGTLLLLVVLGAVAGPEPAGLAGPGVPPAASVPSVPEPRVAAPATAVPGVDPAVPGVAGVDATGSAVPGDPAAVSGDPGAAAGPTVSGAGVDAPAVPGVAAVPGPGPAGPGTPRVAADPPVAQPTQPPPTASGPTPAPAPDPAPVPVPATPSSLRLGVAAAVPLVRLDPATPDPLAGVPAGGAGFWTDAATDRTVLVVDPASAVARIAGVPEAERVLVVTRTDATTGPVRFGPPRTIARPTPLARVAVPGVGALLVVPSGPAALVILEEVVP